MFDVLRIYGMGRERYHLAFLLIKTLKPLGILFIMELYVWACMSARIISI